jgi:hypothetical protein
MLLSLAAVTAHQEAMCVLTAEITA